MNPLSDGARSYLAAGAALAPIETPTAEGLEGYLGARVAMASAEGSAGNGAALREARTVAFPAGATSGGRAHVQFFTPTNVGVLPASLHGRHGTSAHLWLGDAGLTPVSGVLTG